MTALHPDVLPDELDSVARVRVRADSVDPPFLRRMLNLVPGANVQIALVDDPVTEEVEITFAVPSVPPSGAVGGVLEGTLPNPGLNASVAGAGLVEAADVLAVNPDGSTIEIAGDAVQVKDLGISTAKLAAAGVTSAKLEAAQRLPASIAKGAVLIGTAADTVGLRAAGADGTVLGADSADASGWRPFSGEQLLHFALGSAPAGGANSIIPWSGVGSFAFMPRAGSITARAVRLGVARSGGSLTFELTVNGSQVSALDATFNAGNTLQQRDTYALGTHTFSAGDRIACQFDSTAGWTPTLNTINVLIGVTLDP